jgi:hypothetical protein
MQHMKRRFTVDVFTDPMFGGNPLTAVRRHAVHADTRDVPHSAVLASRRWKGPSISSAPG